MIVYMVSLVLAALIGAYVYVETQKRKAIQQKNNAITLSIARIKDKFKEDIKHLVEQDILTLKQYESIYRIANNFFVFQAVTSKSIEFCEHLLNNVISAIPNSGPDSIHYQLAQEQISLFVRALPATANRYNSSFYRKDLPRLIKNLIDSKESIFKVDDDSSDKILAAIRSEAA